MSYLNDMDYAPNDNQLAVAIAAALMLPKSKRQIWCVAPSMGKSRIIATFATIVAKKFKKDLEEIYIAFSSESLLDTDAELYEDMASALKMPVHCSVGMDYAEKNMTKKDLLILDEADWHLLDQRRDMPASYRLFQFR